MNWKIKYDECISIINLNGLHDCARVYTFRIKRNKQYIHLNIKQNIVIPFAMECYPLGSIYLLQIPGWSINYNYLNKFKHIKRQLYSLTVVYDYVTAYKSFISSIMFGMDYIDYCNGFNILYSCYRKWIEHDIIYDIRYMNMKLKYKLMYDVCHNKYNEMIYDKFLIVKSSIYQYLNHDLINHILSFLIK